MDQRIRNMNILRYKDGKIEDFDDVLVEEKPLTIYLNGKEIVTLLCTPEYLDELALGFLLSEGFLKNKTELEDIIIDNNKGTAHIKLSHENLIAEKSFLKRYITTGCGKGTTFFTAMDAMLVKKSENEMKISAQSVIEMVREFQKSSYLFQSTGGVHSAALCQMDKILLTREDIGRHNAVDRIAGNCFMNEIDVSDKILLSSGRISSEILLKIAKMGIAVIVSRSAPTAMAIDFAREMGITVIAFVRGARFNIYSQAERIIID